MQQPATVSAAPLSRLIPTHRAGVALLALDAALLAIPLFVRWQNWFAFAYVPLLVTVVLGALMSGRARLVILLTGIVIPIVVGSLFVMLKASSPSMDLLGIALRGGFIVMICLGVVWLCVAVWGWARFFARDPAAAEPVGAVDGTGELHCDSKAGSMARH